MILFIGQVGGDFVEREAFQEVDYRRMFGEMTKWVAQIDRTDRIAEYVARAFTVATSGRPGPVVLALPEDCLWGMSRRSQTCRPTSASTAIPACKTSTRMVEPAGASRAPVPDRRRQWLDRHGYRARSTGLRERFQLPVGTAWRRLECFDQRHPNAAGHVGWSMTASTAPARARMPI